MFPLTMVNQMITRERESAILMYAELARQLKSENSFLKMKEIDVGMRRIERELRLSPNEILLEASSLPAQ